MSLNTAIPRSFSSHCPSTPRKSKFFLNLEKLCNCCREQDHKLKLSDWTFLIAMLSGTFSWHLSESCYIFDVLSIKEHLINSTSYCLHFNQVKSCPIDSQLTVIKPSPSPMYTIEHLFFPSAQTQNTINVNPLKQCYCSFYHWSYSNPGIKEWLMAPSSFLWHLPIVSMLLNQYFLL